MGLVDGCMKFHLLIGPNVHETEENIQTEHYSAKLEK